VTAAEPRDEHDPFPKGLPTPGTHPGPSAVTIGVFDGVHLGHQSLIAHTRRLADELGGPALLVSFLEHPDALLSGSAPVPLQRPITRVRHLHRHGIDDVIRIPFDERIRKMSAADFAERVLRDALGCEALVLGFDSAICRDREGTVERFAELGFRAERGDPVLLPSGDTVSSSQIRKALAQGEVERAASMLGRAFSVDGRVISGQQRGRTIGFPTANLAPSGIALPQFGVYAVRARVCPAPSSAPYSSDTPSSGRLSNGPNESATLAACELCDVPWRHGVANLGVRPSFGEGLEPLLEVHLFDFDADIYDQTLEVAFITRLRDERRFASVAELEAQIHADSQAAQDSLASSAIPLP
jgi:riboflavin kinase/FMN adenylyltransferase